MNTVYSNMGDVFEFELWNVDPYPLLGNDQVDLTSLNLGDFDISHFSFMRGTRLPDGSGQSVQVRAEFTSLKVTAIPEPSTLVLLGIGLSTIGIATWRRKK